MDTTINTPCTCGRPTFWTVNGVALCWRCTAGDTAVVASVALRNTATGRVFAAGRTVPAADVVEVSPVGL